METRSRTIQELEAELEELRYQLFEAAETIEAIRTGQVDALVVEDTSGHQLYSLKTADEAYRVFIEKMTEGAITLNREGIIIYANSQFATMVKLSLSGVIGLPFENFIAGESKERYAAVFQQCCNEDSKAEVALVAGDSAIPVQLSTTSSEEGGILKLNVILTDLTAQKKAQEELRLKARQLEEMNHALEISNHDLQQFASVASHDLQEPLRKIQMFSNLAIDRHAAELSPGVKGYLSKVADSAARMKALVIDVLNYSKLSAKDNPHGAVDLNEVLKDLLEDFDMLVQDKGASITVGPLPVVQGNTGQLRQVFQSIVSNALKFAHRDRACTIAITAQRLAEKSFNSSPQTEGPFCLITIKDNGIGFDPRYLANIFALFERLHGKDEYEGTGIGLAISKKIIDKHNGLITATGAVGKGAAFLIILPVEKQ